MSFCSARRRSAVMLCCFAAIVPFLSPSARGHTDRAYTVGGIAVGLLAGTAILLWRRSRGNCC